MKRHWALAALLALTAPLVAAFAWQEGIASLGDDSASYLVLAQAMAGSNPLVLPWVGYHTHFPPLFPLLLALTGGAADFRIAHCVVAALAVIAAALAYRFVLENTGRRDAAFAVAAAFMLSPTAWVSVKGILSEPMYLCASLACLLWFQGRLEAGRGTRGQWLAFGLLLAATMLTRVVGAALAAALVLHLGARMAARRHGPPWTVLALALGPAIVLLGLWTALKPVALQDSYQRVSTAMVSSWLQVTGLMAQESLRSAFAGWTASFTGDSQVGLVARLVAGLLAVLALVGTAIRLSRNRLDAWYVLVSLAIVLGWVFSEDNTRRLLYPLVPLLLFHAGVALAWMLEWAGRREWARWAIGAALGVLAFGAIVPAMLLIAQKAFDRQPVIAGRPMRYADITEYYSIVNVERSRALAGRHASVLDGLQAIADATPPGARIMWMRPEYVALLGRREGIAWYYQWDDKRIAREALKARADYLLVARLYKSDLSGRQGDPFATLRRISDYARPALTLSGPTQGGVEFVLMRIDRAALEAFAAGS